MKRLCRGLTRAVSARSSARVGRQFLYPHSGSHVRVARAAVAGAASSGGVDAPQTFARRGMATRPFARSVPARADAEAASGATAGATGAAANANGPNANASGIQRTNIGIFGAMNVGKSLLMNTLTQTETSIVDATAGTTADAKVALIELHGVGPVRLVDTPGFDEGGALGAKKQQRVRKVLAESDVALVLVDPYEPQTIAVAAALIAEAQALGFGAATGPAAAAQPSQAARASGGARRKQILIVYNLFRSKQQRDTATATAGARGPRPDDDFNSRLARIEAQLFGGKNTAAASGPAAAAAAAAGAGAGAVKPDTGAGTYHTIVVDLTLNAMKPQPASAPSAVHRRLCAFIEQWVKPQPPPVPLLPPMPELTAEGNPHRDAVVLLNVPMDAETPGGRLLRPQAHAQEALIRNFVGTFVYRMDLRKGRSKIPAERKAEEDRFRRTVQMLGPALKLVITDSQAIDLVHPWTLPPAQASSSANTDAATTGSGSSPAPVPVPVSRPVPVTTFSVMQINYMSGGRLRQFVDGLKAFSALRSGSRVLICEACNHNRIADDIGVVQIPNKIRARWGDGVQIDFAFGREYQQKAVPDYDVVLHCGGCMLDTQQMGARLADLERANATAITNYGLVLAFFQSRDALARVIQPFGLTLDK